MNKVHVVKGGERAAAVSQSMRAVSSIRAGYRTENRAILAPAAVRLLLLAEQISAPDAPAWLLDLVNWRGDLTHGGALM